ncbi:protein-L-isoaspartate(D-aspartate) O-methyltransferase [Paracoccaceae bacterium]|nr:protein-L-isoaspartate(D-aspartate) O-methyltransferase [Paracoccaceae bacterium]
MIERKAELMLSLRKVGVLDPKILETIETLDRKKFVSSTFESRCYEDIPLPIECGQTISQPSLVALMTQHLEIPRRSKVLEIGTGSGYQAAVLAQLATRVYSIERYQNLANLARNRLEKMKFFNVTILTQDGFFGCPNQAPFDRIILTAAVEDIPKLVVNQLKTAGIMILPVGLPNQKQSLLKIVKTEKGLDIRELMSVRFVQMEEGLVKV